MNTLRYKGFIGSVNFSEEETVMHQRFASMLKSIRQVNLHSGNHVWCRQPTGKWDYRIVGWQLQATFVTLQKGNEYFPVRILRARRRQEMQLHEPGKLCPQPTPYRSCPALLIIIGTGENLHIEVCHGKHWCRDSPVFKLTQTLF